MKAYIAEAIGTFALALTVALSLGGPIGVVTPFLAGLVLFLFVHTIGSVSGTHINPAVTLGLWSIGKIKPKHAIGYIVAQCIGGAVVLLLMKNGFAHATALPVANTWRIFTAEAIGMFFFAFGIAAVVRNKKMHNASGIVIGGSLILGIFIAAFIGSNGMLNPAVALGNSSLSLMYILGPIVGSILGMQVQKYLVKSE